ncbi:MAG: hypothetical protein OXI41_13830 [Chloroflexota bacterium]|nr:hypothetical protein [Chloroflexota bacterium]MDE2896148.1 hypothetical protein [Chloroflexota bacterium]
MKEITVSVDDETYYRACLHAAELKTTIPALLSEYLREVTEPPAKTPEQEAANELRMRKLREVRDEIRRNNPNFRMSDNVPRDELYDRRFI